MSDRNRFRRIIKHRYLRSANSQHRRLACQRLEPRLVLAPVTVTITSFEQIDNPDSSKPGSVAGDYFANVRINGVDTDQHEVFSIDPDFGNLLGTASRPVRFDPFWTYTVDVDPSLGSVEVEIEIVDEDDPGFPLFDPNDLIDINPAAGKKRLTLTVDLLTGSWSGDVPMNQGFAEGAGDSDRGRVFFDISTSSADGDWDGDGLLDGWELFGVDADGDGDKLDLPGLGADPLLKDLFLELDWMPGSQPSREEIQAMKAAFAVAPSTAGVSGDLLPGGIASKPGIASGIRLWVDTGSQTDGTGALIGDDLGGGNPVPFSNVSHLNQNFYDIKYGDGDFDADRRWVFRYGLSADSPNNSSGVANATGNGNNTLNDAGQSWLEDEWVGNNVTVTFADATTQTASVVSSTPTSLQVDAPWTQSVNGASYSINVGGGWGEVGGNDFIEYNHDAGTIMHEFGHTLNLRHGGADGTNGKPNYISVMNYDHQFGIPQNGGGTIIDFSYPRYSVSGTSTGGDTSTTLTDVTQAWTVNQFAGNFVEVVNTNTLLSTSQRNRQVRQVVSNTATQLIVNAPWTVTPNPTPTGPMTSIPWGYSIYSSTPQRTSARYPDISEASVSENSVLDPQDPSNQMVFSDSNGTVRQWAVSGADRNGDGSADGPDYNANGLVDTATGVNLNAGYDARTDGAGSNDLFQPTNDWRVISLPFWQYPESFSDGQNVDVHDTPHPTVDELTERYAQLNTTDLSVSVTDSPDPVSPGGLFSYQVTITNDGPNFADAVFFEQLLPDGASFDSLVGPSTGHFAVAENDTVVRYYLSTLLPGDDVQFTVNMRGGDPGVLTSTAAVSSAEIDPVPGNNTVAVSTTVKNDPPEITAMLLDSRQIKEGDLAELTVDFADPNVLDQHTFIVHWGDGESDTYTLPTGDRDLYATHLYTDDNPTGTPNDSNTIRIEVEDNHGDGDEGTVRIDIANVAPIIGSITVNNIDPVVNDSDLILSETTINENGLITLNGWFTDIGLLDTHTVMVAWGDGSGSTATISQGAGFGTFTATHQYLDDDPSGTPADDYTVTVTVTDDDTGSDTASTVVTVNNVDPKIESLTTSATFGTKANEGETVTLSALFTDVGTLDTHSATVNWGETNSQDEPASLVQANGSGTVSAEHVFGNGGVFTVTMTIIDDDTGSDVETTIAVVVGAGVNNGVLQIVGTDSDNLVTVNKQGNGKFRVHADFFSDKNHRLFDSSTIDGIQMWLCGGDDHAAIAGNVNKPASIVGGDGNDLLIGGGGSSILIGGLGTDRLIGGNKGDILIGGSTEIDHSHMALHEVLDEWNSDRPYADRVAAIDSLLHAMDDGDSDRLTGSAGRDLFFEQLGDDLTDAKLKHELETVL
jgi:hypothetical protein